MKLKKHTIMGISILYILAMLVVGLGAPPVKAVENTSSEAENGWDESTETYSMLSFEDVYCITYTPQMVENTFRYLDDIYLDEYPELGLRFMYGTPSDQQMLTDLAEVITEGCTTDGEKVEAIEHWIQRNIEYRDGSAYPVDTFINRYGDCQSYAQLMVALLRLEGIPAAWGDGWRGNMKKLTPEYMFTCDGHAWCYVYLEGEWVLYDPLWFSGGTTDKEYIASWYYCEWVEGVMPIYEKRYHPTRDSLVRCFIDGRFMIYEGKEPAETSLVQMVNNLFLTSTTKKVSTTTGSTGNLYVDESKDFASMIHGEIFRDGWIRGLNYVYENGIHASGTVITYGDKQYYADLQTTHVFEIICPSDQYSIVGGYFTVAPGYRGKPLQTTINCNPDGTAISNESYTVIWESDDPSIASVDENGIITAVREGLAFISAHFYRDSDGVYMGSGSVYGLSVWGGNRIVDYRDNYTDHEHMYKAIIREDSQTGDGYIIYTCTVGNCAHSYLEKGVTDGSVKSGDVDVDGEVSDWDGIALNRYLAGWDVELDVAAADVDGDGKVSDWDAIILERYLAGWNVKLG